MLDIKFIREHIDEVKKAVVDKRISLDLEDLLGLDERRRGLMTEVENLQATKNAFSKEIVSLKDSDKQAKLLEMKEVDSRQVELKQALKQIDEEYERLMYLVPNIPSKETPIGADESANLPWNYWGPAIGHVDPKDQDKVEQVPPKFSFAIKDHLVIGKDLNLIDTEAGVKTSGYRGYYLKNEAVLIQQALIWHTINKLKEKGFELMIPPILVREFSLRGAGFFPQAKGEIYQIANAGDINGEAQVETTKESLFLAGTSEPSLLAYYSDKIIDEKDLPIKISGLSACYRSEVGSYGKDTKGIYRVHEFVKVEQVVICKASHIEGEQWHEAMRGISEEILQELKLPYRVLNICTGDMGAGKYKQYDIETWMPARNAYGETHSDSNLTDWQARRVNIRYRDAAGKLNYAYTLNNTAIASPRILIAILENYQQADGSVKLPEVLKQYIPIDGIGKK